MGLTRATDAARHGNEHRHAPHAPEGSREHALRIAEWKKAAMHRRTRRIRNTVAVVAVAAFLGPFGLITAEVAAGHGPALANSTKTTTTPPTTTTQAPAPIVTQQS